MKKGFGFILISLIVILQSSVASADASSDMLSLLESMKKQMSQMQQTIDAQNARLAKLENRPEIQIPGPSTTAPTLSENDWQKGIKDNIGESISWMKGLKFGGDFRLRMENFDYFDKNNDAGNTGTANDRSRNRYRIRLRFGFEKDYGDDWKVGFRLATGSTTDQTSTNQTLGNSGYFNFKTINIDRAYAAYSPNGLKDYGPVKGVTIGGGKFDNPFLRYSTAIQFDSDVTPEGLYEKVNFSLASSEENKVNLYTTFGQFILNENTGLDTDANLFGYQGALVWSTYNFNTDQPVDFAIATSYYDYVNYNRTVANNSASTSYLRTNTTALDNPRVLDIYPEVTFYINRIPAVLWYNYVENLGEIDPTRLELSDVHGEDTAWGLGLKYGKAQKKGSWEASYGYYEIGANAVAAAFNDSDFGGPGQAGYTNRKGHKFGLGYALTDSVTVNWTGYIVQPLNATASTISANSTVETVFRSQADLVYKF